MKADDSAETVARIIDQAPPLSPGQRATLRALLAGADTTADTERLADLTERAAS